MKLDDALKSLDAVKLQPKVAIKSTLSCGGCIAASKVEAKQDIPPMATSSMDGYAIRQSSTWPTSGEIIPIQSRTVAGDKSGSLKPSHAIEIMTGALLPQGANTIIPYEWTKAVSGKNFQLTQDSRLGHAVRPKGSDVTLGETLIKTGETIHTGHLMHAINQGITHIEVYEPTNVAIIYTGKEILKNPLAKPKHHQQLNTLDIYFSKVLPQLSCRVFKTSHSKDSVNKFNQILTRWADDPSIDVIITIGGASKGQVDYVRSSLNSMGSHCLFESLNMRPGHPSKAFVLNHKPVFCLPGNPLASICAFEHCCLPWLSQQRQQPTQQRLWAKLAHNLPTQNSDLAFWAGNLENTNNGPVIHPLSTQASYQLSPLIRATHWIYSRPGNQIHDWVLCQAMIN